jgi:hypothetical protein
MQFVLLKSADANFILLADVIDALFYSILFYFILFVDGIL